MEKKKSGSTTVISWLFLLYFVILFAERVQSLVRAVSAAGWFPTAFDGFVNLTVAVSLGLSILLLAFGNRAFWKSLFAPVEPDLSMLTLTAGAALLGGMVHTEFTIPGLQFAAYGMLIAAMLLRTIQLSPGAKSRFSLWYSLIYLTVFSMAIPVVYRSAIARAALFHVIEAVVMLLLVVSFTLMLRRLFLGEGEDLLLWIPFVIMAVGDAVVIGMRWTEEVNAFVLIFAGLAAVMFLVGKPLLHKVKK